MGGSTLRKIGKIQTFGDPFGLFDKPDKPRVKASPKIDEREQQRKIDLVRRVRRQRAASAAGFSSTRNTGPAGLAGSSTGGQRRLLGA